MPDRSLRLLTLPPQSPQGGERGAVLLRERPASPPDAPSGDGTPPEDDNPFAPPPENAPDRPWQPRRPAGGGAEGGAPEGGSSQGGRSPWGGQWSDRQPGRSPGGFGERPGRGPDNGNGNGGPGSENGGKRWDPTDPAQRRARYALLSGMWAFFFVLFGWPYVALLLGALALNWGISALRAGPRNPSPDSPESGPRPQKTAAVSGVVTASLALALVAASFSAQLVYRDYYTCTDDALTVEAKQSCNDLLPKELRKILGTDS
ncbi:hypothetical protein ACWGH3_02860 [Streptomyces sp. NPDC054884]|uniref:hypothetical protein n=1 Tax=Streptomyces sp. ME08-AFT2 TaxID=3028683 RepID=UPI0029BCB25D|nr:hypothetical protein [Streptomyces sp. ME08-AFT2]MDX3307796.1 hypothetical protein [Streptomyces sp. ME08-AFT2]